MKTLQVITFWFDGTHRECKVLARSGRWYLVNVGHLHWVPEWNVLTCAEVGR